VVVEKSADRGGFRGLHDDIGWIGILSSLAHDRIKM